MLPFASNKILGIAQSCARELLEQPRERGVGFGLRDPLYTRVVTDFLTSGGVEPIRLPPKSPNLNVYAERFVRSIKEECLDRVVPLGEDHVRLLARE